MIGDRLLRRTQPFAGWAIVLCLLLSAGLVTPVLAGTYTWTGQAGTNWYATALIPESDPPQYINSFGMSPPVWPGAADDAVVGMTANIWDGHVTLLNLSNSGTISTGGG